MIYKLRRYKLRITCYSLLLFLGAAVLTLAVGPRIHSDPRPIIEASPNTSYATTTRPERVAVPAKREQPIEEPALESLGMAE